MLRWGLFEQTYELTHSCCVIFVFRTVERGLGGLTAISSRSNCYTITPMSARNDIYRGIWTCDPNTTNKNTPITYDVRTVWLYIKVVLKNISLSLSLLCLSLLIVSHFCLQNVLLLFIVSVGNLARNNNFILVNLRKLLGCCCRTPGKLWLSRPIYYFILHLVNNSIV